MSVHRVLSAGGLFGHVGAAASTGRTTQAHTVWFDTVTHVHAVVLLVNAFV